MDNLQRETRHQYKLLSHGRLKRPERDTHQRQNPVHDELKLKTQARTFNMH